MQAANQAQETAASITDSLTDLQSTLVSLYIDPANARLNIGELTTQLSLIAQAGEQAGARALPNVTLRLVERLLPMQRHPAPAMDVAAALEEWVQLSFAYLAEPTNTECWQPLIEFLGLPLWKEQLSPGQIAILQRLFEMDANPPRAAQPAAPVAAAPLDDHKVAVLLEVTGTHAAPVEAVVADSEATMLAEIPHDLLLQMAQEADANASVSALDATMLAPVSIRAALAEAAEAESLSALDATMLAPISMRAAFAEAVDIEMAASAATVADDTVVTGIPVLAESAEPTVASNDSDQEIAASEPTLQVAALLFQDAMQFMADLPASEVPQAAAVEFAEYPELPATADPNSGWEEIALGRCGDDLPAPIAALPGQYEGEQEVAVWVADSASQAETEVLAAADSPWSAAELQALASAADALEAAAYAAGTDATDQVSDQALSDDSVSDADQIIAQPAFDSAVSEVAVWAEETDETAGGFEAAALEIEAPMAAPAFAGAELPPAIAELVAMIHEELNGCMQSLSTALETAATAALTGDKVSLEDYRWQVERLASATQSIGLHGLHEFLARVLEGSCLVESAPVNEVPQQCEVLDRWPPLVDQYLQQPADAVASQALVEYITAQEFAMPLDSASAASLLAKLGHLDIELPAAAAMPARAQQATAADVSLSVPDDIHPELLDSLLHELPAQTQEFSSALQRVAAGSGAADDIRIAQRVAHTLKGSANTVGIRGIAELSHHLEDIFLALEEHGSLPPAALSRTLVDAADCLEAMSEALLGVGPAPAQSLRVLQDVLNWANRIDAHGIAAAVAETTATAETEPTADEPSAAASPARPDAAAHTEAQAEAQNNAQSNVPTLRVASTHVDDLLRLSGENRIVGGQLKEGVRRLESQLLSVRRQNQLFQQLVGELEQLVDIRGVTMPSMRREVNGFDALEMDQYSELHTVSRRLTEAATDAREWSSAAQSELKTLEDLLLSQARHGNESQESILKMRMVPANTIVGRLQRGVRQTCRLLDKEVELTIKGAETLVDSDSLNQLIDPLMHLMRNAIDHGIETAERRLAKGKVAQGHLIIEFGREGNQIFVRCTDDGRGLDYTAIRATAAARGFIDQDATLSDAQLARLILEPGFSTRSEVTQVSGRGIGLDIVHSRVLELKGTFDVQSETGRGCRFMIRLPATLLSAHALLVRHDEHTVAVASRGVRQILDPRNCKVSKLGSRLTLQVGSEIYEAHSLQSLLGQPQRAVDPRTAQPALLIEVTSDRLCAVLVQSVIDTIDVVIKPLGEFVPRPVGVIGATILGNGSVASVLDLPDLLRASARQVAATRSTTNARASGPAPSKLQLPTVLVVDDSLSVRRSMEQLLRDSGYEVQLARDGMEAVAMIETSKPDLMLVDLEMPRMNGMELTAHVRNRAETRGLPVIMITSRSTEKHRKQAEAAGVNHYMTKPFADEALLAQMSSLLKRSA